MNIFVMILQPILFLAVAPLFVGIVRKTKALFQNRTGASVFQPYWSLASLLRKEMTIPEWSTWVYHVVPFVVLGAAFLLALDIPAFAVGFLPSSMTNVFVLTGILAVGSIFLVFGGMDTGSTFGNMGSSREMTLVALIEPTLFLALGLMGAIAGSWDIGSIVVNGAALPWVGMAPVLLALGALVLAALLENARYPVDNPATHLELTMVHEAMLIEYSGTYLAMLEYASAVKLVAISVLVVHIAFPFYIATPIASLPAFGIAVAAFFAACAAAAVGISFIESTVVKMRFYRMQEYALLAFLVAAAALAAAFVIQA